MIGVFVIEQDLFARLDISKGEKQYVTADDTKIAVGFAGVVNELCPIPHSASVDRPVGIDCTDVNPAPATEPHGDLTPRNPFTHVFGDLTPL